MRSTSHLYNFHSPTFSHSTGIHSPSIEFLTISHNSPYLPYALGASFTGFPIFIWLLAPPLLDRPSRKLPAPVRRLRRYLLLSPASCGSNHAFRPMGLEVRQWGDSSFYRALKSSDSITDSSRPCARLSKEVLSPRSTFSISR